jgi:hypothetical protein
MVKRRRRLCLAPETLALGVGMAHEVRQELERDSTVELLIMGLVYDAHSTAAKLRNDPVLRKGLTDHASLSF